MVEEVSLLDTFKRTVISVSYFMIHLLVLEILGRKVRSENNLDRIEAQLSQHPSLAYR
jgi:hypothetical protein